MNIVKLMNDDVVEEFGLFEGIKFLGERFGISDIIEAINRVRKYEFDKEDLTPLEMVENWKNEKELNDLTEQLRTDYIDEEEHEYFQTFEDFLDYDYHYFLSEVLDSREVIKEFAEANGMQFGTAGYSPWSFYIAPNDLSREFIQDVYEGWSFYSLHLLDAKGDEADAVYTIYINDVETLAEIVEEHFGIEDFYLVDNEPAAYFDWKKVREIQDITYSYKVIQES